MTLRGNTIVIIDLYCSKQSDKFVASIDKIKSDSISKSFTFRISVKGDAWIQDCSSNFSYDKISHFIVTCKIGSSLLALLNKKGNANASAILRNIGNEKITCLFKQKVNETKTSPVDTVARSKHNDNVNVVFTHLLEYILQFLPKYDVDKTKFFNCRISKDVRSLLRCNGGINSACVPFVPHLLVNACEYSDAKKNLCKVCIVLH